MAKKKKTQLKPVVRGFATTSIPKKVVQPSEEERAEEPTTATTEDSPPAKDEGTPSQVDKTDASTDNAGTPEEQASQSMIDKYQDKTEREVVRTIKAIDQERRFSCSQARLDLDSTFVDRILSLALDSESSSDVKTTVNGTEEKALARLAITYGVLRRLGFQEDRVEECIRAINGVDLEEAADWLHLHCSLDELGMHQDVDGTRTPPSDTPQTPRTPSLSQFSLSNVSTTPLGTPTKKDARKIGRLDANAPAFVPSAFMKVAEPGVPSYPASGIETPSSSSDRVASTVSSSGSHSPVDDPNIEYVRVKMQISELTTHRQMDEQRDAAFLQSLKRRLEDIRQDYLFDATEAEAQFRIERQKSHAQLLQSRLRGAADKSAAAPTSEPPKPCVPQKPLPVEPVNKSSTQDVFDEDEDGSSDGLFAMLEEMPATEVTDEGTTISVRDMALPKHWSGRTPKALLHERVHKVDRFAIVTYRDISGTSRAKRAALEIRWQDGKAGAWSMDNVACHDQFQAEQYISTVALHALSFPSSEGFALGSTSVTSSQTSFRLLPAIYRDLWDELEKGRLNQDEATNRAIWAKLRAILEPKLTASNKSKNTGSALDAKAGNAFRSAYRNSDDLSPEQISAGFQARASSSAYQEMLQHREQLPIAKYRNEIMSILEMSQILVLSGETGCGKSTQVPAFILEDQLAKGRHCKIYCTEPRRISAISLAQRVSRELGEPAGAVGTPSSIVGYSIRLESNINSRTRLAYVTNGIALRMLEGGSGQGGQGTAFDEITHIIIDEVHERTIESDFLLIVLKSLLQERPDLKVVLMSATVDAEKISNYFGGTPILKVPGRTFPVDVRFLEDAIELTKWKVTENSPYARRGKDKFNRGKGRIEWSEDVAAGDDDDEGDQQENVKLEKRYSPNTASTINTLDERLVPYDLIVRLLEHICFEDLAYANYSQAVLIFMPGMGEIRKLNDLLMEHPQFNSEETFKIYPLHSMISSEHQGAVFDIPPPGVRKIVIATNIAETGITIPDITCVIDTGRQREMRFDEKRQISRLVETFVAKSNAAQRRGRAGRVQSGLCFHLFTKLRHDTKMAAHPDPEMMRLSLSDLALRIKIMKVKLGSSIEDVLSKALDPPLAVNIQRAVSALVEVRALTPSEDITPMGRLLSKLPTDVHLGKFLLIASLFRCLDPALTIAATLNAKSPFISPLGHEQEADRAKGSFRVENSDFLTIHNAFASWRQACANGIGRKFCKTNFLSYQNLQQIEELRQQFLGYLVDSSFIRVDNSFVRELSRARYGRGRTRFVPVPPELEVNTGNAFMLNAALAAGLYPKLLSIDSTTGDMKTVSNNQVAAFHPSSVNFGKRAREFGVNYLSYFTLMHSKKLYAWETGPVDDVAMLLLCGEAEFKLMSDIVYVDRKIKFRVQPRSGIALKILRNHLADLLSTQMRIKPLTESQTLWDDVAMMVLGKVKPREPGEYQENITLVVNR